MARYIIGDIHGCARSLVDLVVTIDPKAGTDELIFVGDYIDRGPDTYGVVAYLLSLSETFACTFLRGNHESMMLRAYAEEQESQRAHWLLHGGEETLLSYAVGTGSRIIPSAHWDFFGATRWYRDDPDAFIVHGGVSPDVSIAKNLAAFYPEDFLWQRAHLGRTSHPHWEKKVVCGHTPLPEPLMMERLWAIDTGCVYPQSSGFGRLSAVCLETAVVTSVPFSG